MTDDQILEIVETILPQGRTYSPEVWLDFAHKIAAGVLREASVNINYPMSAMELRHMADELEAGK